jgi:hypothetical protein
VRRAEVATRPELTHTRWLWLKNWANLSTGGRRELPRLLRPLSPARHRRKPYAGARTSKPSTTTIQLCAEYLRSRCSGAKRSRLQPIKDFPRANRTPLGRHHRLARHPRLQRTTGRNQLPDPGGQSPRPRLPHQEQDDHYCLPHRRPTATTHRHQPQPGMISSLSATHTKQRGAVTLLV